MRVPLRLGGTLGVFTLAVLCLHHMAVPNPPRANVRPWPDEEPKVALGKKKPRDRFIFHALHKTGSSVTRRELKRFCIDRKLRCLSYTKCSANYTYCAQGLSRALGREVGINRGSFTLFRLTHGCCPRMLPQFHLRQSRLQESSEFRLDAIVDHMPLNAPGNREFIRKHTFSNSFRFTVLRDPIDQFLSYFSYLKGQPEYFGDVLAKYDLDSFLRLYSSPSPEELDMEESVLVAMLANSQSQELGWDGDPDTLKDVFQYLEDLDFVGIYEELEDTWGLLRFGLGWSEQYFSYNTTQERNSTTSRARASLSRETLDSLSTVQWADVQLYERGRQLFSRFQLDAQSAISA